MAVPEATPLIVQVPSPLSRTRTQLELLLFQSKLWNMLVVVSSGPSAVARSTRSLELMLTYAESLPTGEMSTFTVGVVTLTRH